jgi:predicted transcriptional regulator
VNVNKLHRERERAFQHELRRTILATLGRGKRTLPELASSISNPPSLAVLAYHLRILHRVRMVDCVGGVYQLSLP